MMDRCVSSDTMMMMPMMPTCSSPCGACGANQAAANLYTSNNTASGSNSISHQDLRQHTTSSPTPPPTTSNSSVPACLLAPPSSSYSSQQHFDHHHHHYQHQLWDSMGGEDPFLLNALPLHTLFRSRSRTSSSRSLYRPKRSCTLCAAAGGQPRLHPRSSAGGAGGNGEGSGSHRIDGNYAAGVSRSISACHATYSAIRSCHNVANANTTSGNKVGHEAWFYKRRRSPSLGTKPTATITANITATVNHNKNNRADSDDRVAASAGSYAMQLLPAWLKGATSESHNLNRRRSSGGGGVVGVHLIDEELLLPTPSPTTTTATTVTTTTAEEELEIAHSHSPAAYHHHHAHLPLHHPNNEAATKISATSLHLPTGGASPVALASNYKPIYRVYPQRWLVLATVCLLALSNCTLWIAFAPLHDATTAFYCNQQQPQQHETIPANSTDDQPEGPAATVVVADDCDVEYWTSQIFQLVGVITGLFGMYITDRHGIRYSCFCGTLFNLVGAVVRVFSSLPLTPKEWRLTTLYVGQTIAAAAQPFFLCLSPKVAEYWFADDQRALANALSFVANPLGVVLGSMAPVLFVSSQPQSPSAASGEAEDDSGGILRLNVALLTLASLVMLVMGWGVRANRPPSPPSASSECQHKPAFFDSLWMLAHSPIFYVQIASFGMAFALQWSLFITADKLLSTRLGYPDGISGWLIAATALSGCAASVLAGAYVDWSRRFKELVKGCYIGIAATSIALNFFLRHPYDSALDAAVLVGLVMALGFFAIPVFPISLELGVETTFPVPEAASSGVLIIAGQLMLFLLAFLMQWVESSPWLYYSSSSSNHHDLTTNVGQAFGGGEATVLENYQLGVDLWTLTAICAALFVGFGLRPKYYRVEYEENAMNIIKMNLNIIGIAAGYPRDEPLNNPLVIVEDVDAAATPSH